MGAPEDEYDDIVGYLVSKVMRNDEIAATSLHAWMGDRYGVEPSIPTLAARVTAIQATLHADQRPADD
jgi:hypothetical protein